VTASWRDWEWPVHRHACLRAGQAGGLLSLPCVLPGAWPRRCPGTAPWWQRVRHQPGRLVWPDRRRRERRQAASQPSAQRPASCRPPLMSCVRRAALPGPPRSRFMRRSPSLVEVGWTIPAGRSRAGAPSLGTLHSKRHEDKAAFAHVNGRRIPDGQGARCRRWLWYRRL
jgi:hypothetical protein